MAKIGGYHGTGFGHLVPPMPRCTLAVQWIRLGIRLNILAAVMTLVHFRSHQIFLTFDKQRKAPARYGDPLAAIDPVGSTDKL